MATLEEKYISRVIASHAESILEETIEFISQNYDPEEVFTTEQLEKWAEQNGYIQEDKAKDY